MRCRVAHTRKIGSCYNGKAVDMIEVVALEALSRFLPGRCSRIGTDCLPGPRTPTLTRAEEGWRVLEGVT